LTDRDQLVREIEELRLRLDEAEQTLEAIRCGAVDSIVVEGPEGPRVFALDAAAQSYRVLVEAMNEGAATLSEGGIILYSNGRFAGMLQAPLEQVIGSRIRDAVAPGWRSALEGLMQEAWAGESKGEIRLLTKGGSELPAYMSLSRVDDSGRRALCLVATDLTEQKRSQEMLATEKLTRLVLEQAAEAVVVCDAEGKIIRAGRAAEELSSHRVRALFDELYVIELAAESEDRERASGANRATGVAAQTLRGRVLRAAPGALRRPDGSLVHLLVSATALRGSDDQVIGCVISMVDVTRNRLAEEELARAKARLEMAQEAARIGTFEWDFATDQVLVTEGLAKVFGVRLEELSRYQLWQRRVHPDDVERVEQLLGRVAAGYASYETEYRIVWPDGSVHWVGARGRVQRDPRGRPTGLVGANMDLTELKRAEEEVREADRNKSHFMAMLSHELRNPLAPITNSLYILDRADPGGEQARRARSILKRQVGHLSRLIDDLLDVTRVASGKMQLKREPIELGELVRRTLEDHRSAFVANGVALEVFTCDTPVPCWGDGTRIAQVLGNLLQNAAKFTPRGGRTRVTLERTAAEAVIRVEDNGAGIAKEILPRIFEPFSQGDRTLDRSVGGLGLGLSLVKGLAEMHGGSVSARSEGPGKGAEFAVRLPLEEVAAEPRRPPPDAAERRVRRVLIIEDDVDSADSLREALELGEHAVEVAHDGPEGLAKARRFLPEVVFCDIGLPGMNGYQVAQAMRTDPSLASALLVAITGYASGADLATAKSAGFDRHLAKPPAISELERILASAG
jgi:PAS domain S-box-containing protein